MQQVNYNRICPRSACNYKRYMSRQDTSKEWIYVEVCPPCADKDKAARMNQGTTAANVVEIKNRCGKKFFFESRKGERWK